MRWPTLGTALSRLKVPRTACPLSTTETECMGVGFNLQFQGRSCVSACWIQQLLTAIQSLQTLAHAPGGSGPSETPLPPAQPASPAARQPRAEQTVALGSVSASLTTAQQGEPQTEASADAGAGVTVGIPQGHVWG